MTIVIVLAIVTVLAIETIMAIVTDMASSRSFRTRTRYQIEETYSRVARNSFQGSLRDTVHVSLINAEVAKTVTNLLRRRCPSLARSLCCIMTLLVTVKEGDDSSL